MVQEQSSRHFGVSDSQLWKHFATSSLVCAAVFCLAVVLSWRDGAFRGEFGDDPDEAGHYVTGLMFHDYFAGMHYSSPTKFAVNYYLHYPKVGIGHWPPIFYVIQGIWTLLFSTSRSSLMFLMATLTALLALTIYGMLAREFSPLVALAASLVFVALPAVQASTGTVMADVPTALFSFLAAVYFGRFLDTERQTDVLAFGVFSALAIMTKANAIGLALLAPIAILLTRKWNLLRRPALWGSGALVLIICGPWYVWTLQMQREGLTQHTTVLSFWLGAMRFYGSHIIGMLGWGVSLLAVIGLAAKLRAIWKSEDHSGTWAAMIGLFLGFFLLLSIIPTGPDARYLLLVVPAAIGFAVAGLYVLGGRLRSAPRKPLYLGLGLVLLFAVTGFGAPQKRSYGFGPLSQMLVSQNQFRHSVFLASLDTDGEGMFVSEIAMRERRPGHVILRASKVLANSEWNGGDYQPLFSTPQQVLQYLDSIPVDVVVTDSSIPEGHLDQHEKLLEQAMSTSADCWKLLAKYPVWREDAEYPDALRVYVRVGARRPARGVIHLDMRRTLGKSLTFQLSSESGEDLAPSEPEPPPS